MIRVDPELSDVLRRALALSPSSRATLVGSLLASLDDQRDDAVEAAWDEEIRRRIEELDSGEVQAIPWSEVRARLLRRSPPE